MAHTPEPTIATVVIDGPDGNMLNPDVMAQIKSDLIRADEDDAVSGILLTGAGAHFCGGLDLAGIKAGGDPVEFAGALADLLQVFPKLRKPIAAAVNAHALASGAALVAASDYAVMVPDVKIGSYEVAVGVWPVVAQVPLIQRLGPRLAMENIGSGEPFTAERALELGLVNALASPEELIGTVTKWLTLAARGGAANAGRRFFYEVADLPYAEALQQAHQNFAQQFKGNTK